ncbi:MAG: response regulator [Candidatus Dojkabacteria bacterium]
MKKILIVEDEIAYSRILEEVLKKEDYTIITARNGKEGLEAASSEHPDIILLDIRMPVMDGTEMLTELRKTEYGAKVKVVMLTNLEPDREIITKVVKDQPTYYLIKSDISIEELKAKIKLLLLEDEDETLPKAA